MKELFDILQFVIPTEKYSLCLVNPEKEDVHSVYIMYSGHAVKKNMYYVYEPIHMQTDILYSESYALLDEYSALDLDSTYHYELLYVYNGEIYLQKFYRKCLDNVVPVDKHPLFHTSIWKIENIATEYIPLEDIMTVVQEDPYSKNVPKKSSKYRHLILKSELFKLFFDDLYKEMDNYLRGDKRQANNKWDFGELLFSLYGVQFENIEGTEVILSKCAALMDKLNISKYEMTEYYMKFLNK